MRPLIAVGYSVIALNHAISGVPNGADITNSIPTPLPFPIPAQVTILRRCTLQYADPSQNYRLARLAAAYDVFALRPTSEKALQQACQTLDCDVISLDLSVRHPFFFHIKTLKMALERGVRFEICYAPGIANTDGGAARRNLISNVVQLVRATRGRGLVVSSEARTALNCRGPADLINLCVLWGLARDRAAEAVSREARNVVVQAQMKRRSFKGVIDVIDGGVAAAPPLEAAIAKVPVLKRRVIDTTDEAAIIDQPEQLSKREQKRRAKKARMQSTV